MAILYKFVLFAVAAVGGLAAPIDPSISEVLPPRRHTTAAIIPDSELNLSNSLDTVVSVTASTNGLFSGRATWFTDKTGSCGKPFDTNDMIVAMNAAQMDGTSQCGRQVRITAKGQSVVATVVDTCPSRYCSSGSLDLSQAVFKKLAPLDVGVIQISWSFV